MVKALFFEDNIANYYPGDIFGEIYKDRIYFPYLTGKKDLTILDVGANLGWTAQYFSDYASKVYAVEPSKQHADIIRQMIKYNKLDNIEVIESAVSSEPGEKLLYHNRNKTMFSLSQTVDDKSDKPEKIMVTTIEQIMLDNNLDHVDFMKLDTEGEEAIILCSPSFKRIADKIDTFIFEYHQWSGRNPSQIRTALKDLGFSWAQMNTNASVFMCSRIK